MVSPTIPLSHIDVVKEPQYVTEGNLITTPTLYGVTPDDAVFLSAGANNTSLVSTYSPTKIDKRRVGHVDRTGETVTKKKYSATLVTKISDINTSLVLWGCNIAQPDDVNSSSHTKTFVKSYNDNQGIETFEVFSGCLPEKASIRWDKDGDLELTIDMRCKEIIETQDADGGLTNPTWAAIGDDDSWPAKELVQNTRQQNRLVLADTSQVRSGVLNVVFLYYGMANIAHAVILC